MSKKKISKPFKMKLIYLITIFLVVIAAILLIWEKNYGKFPAEPAIAFPTDLAPAQDHIIVQFKEDVSQKQEQAIASAERSRASAVQVGEDVKFFSVPEGKTAQDLTEEIQAKYTDKIEYTELDNQAMISMVPNDPMYNYQWQLPKVSAPNAWDIEQGAEDIVVAVLDTGVSAHADISAKYLGGYNFVDNNINPEDGHGHGTFVSGMIAAVTNNNLGVAGSAPNVKIMPVKVLSDAGWGYYSWVAQGIVWATDHGADVINMSLGGSASSSLVQDAVNYAHARGVTVVAAAGNSGTSDPSYPGACEYVVGVGATDSQDRLASFSQYGDWVDVTAPGVSVFSARKGGGYGYWSGTSFSSPMVAALVSLVQAKESSYSPNQIELIIEQNADDLGAPGKDDYFAWGRVNYFKALSGSQAPPPDLVGSISGKVVRAGLYTPIQGINVDAYTGGSRVARTKTLSNGTYVLENLNPGSYYVRVSGDNYGTRISSLITLASGEDVKNVNFVVPSKASVVVGRVINKATRRGISGATVRIYTKSRLTVAKTTTNSLGYYYFDNISQNGSLNIYANKTGYYISRRSIYITEYSAYRYNFSLVRR
jgi:hypothetical protein